MRDPNRIPIVLAAVQLAWEHNTDLRLGQLLESLRVDVGEDIFYMEDGELTSRLMQKAVV